MNISAIGHDHRSGLYRQAGIPRDGYPHPRYGAARKWHQHPPWHVHVAAGPVRDAITAEAYAMFQRGETDSYAEHIIIPISGLIRIVTADARWGVLRPAGHRKRRPRRIHATGGTQLSAV